MTVGALSVPCAADDWVSDASDALSTSPRHVTTARHHTFEGTPAATTPHSFVLYERSARLRVSEEAESSSGPPDRKALSIMH